jgi:hypothetical protein
MGWLCKSQEGTEGCKRPPCIGLAAFLVGILFGLFIPLSKRLRKK